MSTTTTRTPSSDSRRALAAPIPPPAPVTPALLPSRALRAIAPHSLLLACRYATVPAGTRNASADADGESRVDALHSGEAPHHVRVVPRHDQTARFGGDLRQQVESAVHR